jgi:hypothetical protein
MAVDTNRTGPDQSINNPNVLLALLGKVRYIDDLYSAFKVASDSKDPDLTNVSNPNTLNMIATPNLSDRLIPNISIPLRLGDGSIETYGSEYAVGASLSQAFNNDLHLIAPREQLEDAVIQTYANLAELFRDYWLTMNQFPSLLEDYTAVGNLTVTDPAGTVSDLCSTSDLSPGLKFLSEQFRPVDTESFEFVSVNFEYWVEDPFVPRPTPSWRGEGPVSYFDTTYPQLRDRFNDITPNAVVDTVVDNSTDFLYRYFATVSAEPAPTGNAEPKSSRLFNGVNGTVIFNTSETASLDVTATTTNSTTYGNLIFDPSGDRHVELFCKTRIIVSDFNGSLVEIVDDTSTVDLPVLSGGAINTGLNSSTESVSIPPLGSARCIVDTRSRHINPIIGVSLPFGSSTLTIDVDGVSASRFTAMGFFGSPCP